MLMLILFLGILQALARARNTLWARPCMLVCLPVAFFLGGRQPVWPGSLLRNSDNDK
jgi:hypothetical protein